ncbi:hypothetical protein SAMN05443661_11118 [Natronobacterium gregoryi]|uniref:Uncharacterized protein n=2 Tax=Natronobacterium gregoryi TaxID=44930 RepID=A0A2J4JCJ1_NATGS|nr:hypothetical protein CYV19_13930 [Natronobacterium gregoryi SP2]SFJ00337.1 hypothetical protein SAMN05443661_11118 [Natronobacterium gregoryi]
MNVHFDELILSSLPIRSLAIRNLISNYNWCLLGKKTLWRIITAMNARAVVINSSTGDIDRLLVPLTGMVDTDRIFEYVSKVIGPVTSALRCSLPGT